MSKRIAIVEDNAGICEELQHLIARTDDMECVAVSRNANHALKTIPKAKPDVVIMDIHLPDGSGTHCTTELKRYLPDTQIVMFTINDEADTIIKALEAGATGYILKDSPPADILKAIQEVSVLGAPLSREVARKIITSFHRPPLSPEAESLTPREHEILDLLSDGLFYKEIAEQLSIKIDTVNTHIKSIYRKLQVHTRMDAVARYRR